MPVRPVTRNDSQTAPLKDKSTTDFKNVSAEQTPGAAAGTPGQDKAAQPGDKAGQPTGRATTLLNDDGTANNCLEQAAKQAKAGQDVVFLDNAAPKANGAGHAVIEDRKTGQVIDPEALGGKRTYASLGDYLQAAKAGGHDFSVAGHASGEEVRAVLAKPQGERAAFIARTDPSLGAVEDHSYAIAVPPPIPPKDPKPKDPKPADPKEGAVPSDVPLVVNDKNPADGTILKGLMNVAHDWKDLGLGKTFKPTDKPKDDHARDELAFIKNNPTLAKVLGGKDGDISKKDVEGLIKKDQDNAKDLQETGSNDPYKGLTGLNDQQAKDVRKPLEEAKLLASHWDDWGFAGGQSWDPKNLPNNLSNEEAMALRDVETGALGKAVTADHNTSKPDDDGTITKKDILHFIDKATKDGEQASKDYQKWVLANSAHEDIKNPGYGPTWKAGDLVAGDTGKDVANSAAVLEANSTLLSAENNDKTRPVEGTFRADDLEAAKKDFKTNGTIAGAAALFSAPGMLDQVDTAGKNKYDNPADGKVNRENMSFWLANSAPATDDQTMALFNNVSLNAVNKDTDLSHVDKADLLKNPDKYTGQQKAKELSNLEDDKVGYMSLDEDGRNIHIDGGIGVNNNKDVEGAQVQDAIDKLSADPDVIKYKSEATKPVLDKLVNANGNLSVDFSHLLMKAQDGELVDDDMKVNGATTKSAIHDYIHQAGFLQAAYGLDGTDGKGFDLSTAVKSSGSYNKILQSYKDDIVSGKELANNTPTTKKGEDGIDALQLGLTATTGEVQDYNTVLGPDVVKQYGKEAHDNLSGDYQDQLLRRQSDDIKAHPKDNALVKAFGDKDGNFDSKKAMDYVKALQNGPAAPLMVDKDGKKIEGTDAVQFISSIYGAVRSGAYLHDALANGALISGTPNTKDWLRTQFQNGNFGFGSLLFSGTLLGLHGSEAKSPTDIAGAAISGVNMLSTAVYATGQAINTPTSVKAANAAADTAQRGLEQARQNLSTASENASKAESFTHLMQFRLDSEIDANGANSPRVPHLRDDLHNAQIKSDEAEKAARQAASAQIDAAGKWGDAQAVQMRAKAGGDGPVYTRQNLAQDSAVEYNGKSVPSRLIYGGFAALGLGTVAGGINSIVAASKQVGQSRDADLALANGVLQTAGGISYAAEGALGVAAGSRAAPILARYGLTITNGLMAGLDIGSGVLSAAGALLGLGTAVFGLVEQVKKMNNERPVAQAVEKDLYAADLRGYNPNGSDYTSPPVEPS